MVSEAKSGAQYFDVHIGGTESIVTGLLPENILEPVELFSSCRTSGIRSNGGAVTSTSITPSGLSQLRLAYQTVSLWTNPNEYKPAEFKSFDDLLSAKAARQDRHQRSAYTWSGSSMWSIRIYYIKGEEFLKRLVAQKLFVTRDLRLLAENLAKGKIAVTSGIGYSEFYPFIKANLPVVPLSVPKEGLYVSGGYGHLTVFKNQPHPNATRVFINWLLSHDGQEVFARGMGVGTRRLDVETKWLKEFGVISGKDFLTLDQFYRLENQSEEKINKIREPAAVVARKLLGS
jgi:iron(III) transport system substrate-binding protein